MVTVLKKVLMIVVVASGNGAKKVLTLVTVLKKCTWPVVVELRSSLG